MITVEKENNVLDEVKWLNYQCGSLVELCHDILEGNIGLENIEVALMQIEKGIIGQIDETIQHLPQPTNHIKCPKCGGENFVICEYGVWDAEPIWDNSKRKWILSATGMSDSGIDLIECKACIRNSSSDDLTENFIHEVEFNG